MRIFTESINRKANAGKFNVFVENIINEQVQPESNGSQDMSDEEWDKLLSGGPAQPEEGSDEWWDKVISGGESQSKEEDSGEPGKSKVYLKSKEELQDEILDAMQKESSSNINFNYLDVSDIDNMDYLFSEYYDESDRSTYEANTMKLRSFNGNIGKWDMRNVKSAKGMFKNSKFTGENGSINRLNFTNCADAREMFMGCDKFDSDISSLKFASGAKIDFMFTGCSSFNASNIDSWDVSGYDISKFDPIITFLGCKSMPSWASSLKVVKVQNKNELQDKIVEYCKVFKEFTGNELENINLNHLDVSEISDFSYLFSKHYKYLRSDRSNSTRGNNRPENIMLQRLNPDVSQWNMENAENTAYMFAFGSFDGDISQWKFNPDKWKNAYAMFYSSKFSGKNLTSGSSVVHDVQNLQAMEMMFFRCNELKFDFKDMPEPLAVGSAQVDSGEYKGRFFHIFPAGASYPEWYERIKKEQDKYEDD